MCIFSPLDISLSLFNIFAKIIFPHLCVRSLEGDNNLNIKRLYVCENHLTYKADEIIASVTFNIC